MPLPGRKRASVVLLLVLTAGLAAAAVAGAAAAQDMACCPMGMEAERGCTWLGVADCCAERPGAPAPANAAPPAPAAFGALTLPVASPVPAAFPACVSHAQRAPLRSVLRL